MTIASPPSLPLSARVGPFLIRRPAFAATVVAAAALLWLAPRLPMIDLPQHAAQVALWRDLLRGVSPWADIVRINLLTPYLLGYALLLPLSFLMPLALAVKVLLTADLLGFVAACVALRRALAGDPRLDWLFLIGFFGFAWQWGFLTFITAAPLGLVFVLVALRQAGRPNWATGALLVGIGLLLLFSHALIFLMACGLGGLLALRGLFRQPVAAAIPGLVPYLVLAAALIGFRLLTRGDADALQYDRVAFGVPLWLRPVASLAFVTARDWGSGPATLAVLSALAAPVLLKCRLNVQGGAWLLGGLCVLLLVIPDYAMRTAYLADRFALFLVPFVALACRPPAVVAHGPRERLGSAAAAVGCWVVLAISGWQIAAFAAESRSFETVLTAAEPGRRAVALIYDRNSPGAGNAEAYMHYAAWYGAEKRGFVDFNFAWFPPQVVRFRADSRPAVTDRIGWHPDTFDWVRDGATYDLVFFRGDEAQLASVRSASPCPLPLLAQDGPWRLLRRQSCAAAP